MRNRLSSLVLLLVAGTFMGCGSDGDTIIGSTGGILNNNDSFPASSLFRNNWPDGSGFNPAGTPPFDVEGKGKDLTTGVEVSHSNPALGSLIPFDFDDIRFVGYGETVLTGPQIDFITASYNNGRPNKAHDTVVIPSLAQLTPPNERYLMFKINVKAILEAFQDDPEMRLADGPRTHVIGIAFGNGTGGYVPVAPNTADSFAGALVWMKVKREQDTWPWSMDQRDWRQGNGGTLASSMRVLIRGDAVIAIIKAAELEAMGVTQFRWDAFSYTTDPSTEWSHDYTDWVTFR